MKRLLNCLDHKRDAWVLPLKSSTCKKARMQSTSQTISWQYSLKLLSLRSKQIVAFTKVDGCMRSVGALQIYLYHLRLIMFVFRCNWGRKELCRSDGVRLVVNSLRTRVSEILGIVTDWMEANSGFGTFRLESEEALVHPLGSQIWLLFCFPSKVWPVLAKWRYSGCMPRYGLWYHWVPSKR